MGLSIRPAEILLLITDHKISSISISALPESEQVSGAFKIRGAYNKILKIVKENPKAKDAGFTTASSGNHGKACVRVYKIHCK